MTDIKRSARISECGKFRYTLSRFWGHGPDHVLWIMLNPSTADGTVDDPTIRRCIGYSQAWGYDWMNVCNLFAFRATSPSAVPPESEAIGPDNDRYLVEAIQHADLIVAAWGVHAARYDARVRAVRRLLRGSPVHVLALNRGGEPVHPLYQPKGLKPQRWLDIFGRVAYDSPLPH